jgi:multidrug resistance efflux pump
MVVDPTGYKISVSLAEAAVEQAQATAQNAETESRRRQTLNDLAATTEEKQAYAANALAGRAAYPHASASLDQANVNLKRTAAGQRLCNQPAGTVRRLCERRTKDNAESF